MGIAVLDHVVPRVPLPHDAGAVERLGLELQDHVRPHAVLRGHLGPETHLLCLVSGLGLPGNSQDVAVGHHRDVVVQQVFFAGEPVVPDQIALPCEFLNPTSLPAAGEHGDLQLAAAAEQVSVVEQIDERRRYQLAFPRTHDRAADGLDEVGHVRQERREVDVAGAGGRCVQQEAARLVIVHVANGGLVG